MPYIFPAQKCYAFILFVLHTSWWAKEFHGYYNYICCEFVYEFATEYRSSSTSFNFQYFRVSLRLSSSCLGLLPRLPFPVIHLAFFRFIIRRICAFRTFFVRMASWLVGIHCLCWTDVTDTLHSYGATRRNSRYARRVYQGQDSNNFERQ